MKKTTQKVAIVLLLLGTLLCDAQEIPDARKILNLARLQLVEGRKSYDPESAISSYTQLATEGNSEAMNALGVIYSKGISVPVNEVLGLEWLEKSVKAGYLKAWYNLGLLYKEKEPTKAISCFEKAAVSGIITAYSAWGSMLMKGNGVTQNYSLAMSVFKEGAEKGSGYCCYSQGYLYYKGFGCVQNYDKAVQLFEIAAQKNNPWAMYMLGLCYRNGYGLTIDLEKAKYWLNKSASMGVKPSQMELADPEAENFDPIQTKTVSKPIDEIIVITEAEIPETFKKVKQTPIATAISGNYTGNLLRYDWSGQNIISSTPLEIDLQQDGKHLSGEWKETQGDTVAFTAEIKENAIVFKDTRIDRTEHFYKGRLNRYEFKEAQLQLLQTDESLFLVGNLQLYNIKERENEKPMYLILEKKQAKISISIESEILSKVAIYPNPFNNSFELSFDLVQATDVTASVYSLTGQTLFTTHWNNLTQGKQSKTINLNAPSGCYLLRLSYGQEIKTAILIKK